jgi:hypothetical protein
MKPTILLFLLILLITSCRYQSPIPSFVGEYNLSDIHVSIRQEQSGTRVFVNKIDYGYASISDKSLAAILKPEGRSGLTIERTPAGLYLRYVNLAGGFNEGVLTRGK